MSLTRTKNFVVFVRENHGVGVEATDEPDKVVGIRKRYGQAVKHSHQTED